MAIKPSASYRQVNVTRLHFAYRFRGHKNENLRRFEPSEASRASDKAPGKVSPAHAANFTLPARFAHSLHVSTRRGTASYGLDPLPAKCSRLDCLPVGVRAGCSPKTPPRGFIAATGGEVVQSMNAAFRGHCSFPRPHSYCPGSVGKYGDSAKL